MGKPLYLGSYWSDLDEKIWAYSEHRGLSNGPGPIPQAAIVSEKTIVYEGRKETFPEAPGLFSRFGRKKYGPIGRKGPLQWPKDPKRPFQRPRARSLGAIVSEKKIVKEYVFFHGSGAKRPSQRPPARSHGAVVSEKKIVKEKFFLPLIYIKRYNLCPVGQILWWKMWVYRAQKGPSSGPGPVPLGAISDLDEKIWAYRAQRDLSNVPPPVPLCAIVSVKKIVKENFFFPLFYINRYISAPIGQIWTKKIWAYRAQRAFSMAQDLDEKIWAYRALRGLSRGPGPVL
ncbi:hypothetical protein HZH68_003921 [Vespula germanica]|uniref:Uncharacterized protein n=1 Tax=Vespula germanica TaxID=30212 RepID=A0A834KMS6_VESGE|nr:hypothetical protein HZH68_003921 [Vespula germanica]